MSFETARDLAREGLSQAALREADRLSALHETGLLDTEPEAEFDTVVALAARLFNAPIAMMTLIDDHRQWLKARFGLSDGNVPRSESICATAVDQNAPLVVSDLLADPRFAHLPGVGSDLPGAGQVRSYAGVPIAGRDGLPLGTICVLDTEPRDFDGTHLEMLHSLGQIIGDELDLRRRDSAAGIDSATARQDASALRLALDADQLTVFFQPVMDLASGAVRSVEALVRWNHPTRGLLSPADFLPLAEVTGLGYAIDRWVFSSAISTIAELRSWTPALADLGVAVNVQLPSGVDESWAHEIKDGLASAGLPPQALTLEVTERSMDGASRSAVAALESLVGLGCRVAIDDIGTGMSSLVRLAEMPASEVKIDRTFVHTMLEDRRRAAVVRALARLGSELGMDVVAEGVEDDATAAAVVSAGCTAGQGYYWARPMGKRTLFDFFLDTSVPIVGGGATGP